jgi:CRP/FNR family transcriptional regulator
MTAREKLAAFLVSLAQRDAMAGGRPAPSGRTTIVLPLSREAIADYLGLTIETTSRQMTALRKDGVFAAPNARTIEVPSFEDLILEAGGDDDGGPII